MRQKRNIKRIAYGILTALVICLFIATFLRLTYVFRLKEYTNVQDNFRVLKKDSVDMVFIGTSHQFCSINTDLLAEEYDINAYMLATSAQTVPMSYYAAMEAIELQHPKAIVFELLYCANDFRTVTTEMSHTFFDGMPRCKARTEALRDLVDEKERIYYELPLGFYHTRWKELKEEDFESNLISPRGNHTYEEVKYNWGIPVIGMADTGEAPEEMLRYLNLLIALCKENDVKLITYVAPYNSLYNDDATREDLFRMQKIFNSLTQYLGAQEIPCYNLFYELQELNLDGNTDWMDSQHVNNKGQEKITRYMAEKGYFDY